MLIDEVSKKFKVFCKFLNFLENMTKHMMDMTKCTTVMIL